MNNKSTTHKAEGLGNGEKRKAETLKAEIRSSSVPQFENEQQFLDGLRTFMQAGRESRAPGVARLARFWERKIMFSILVTQQQLERRKAAKAERETLKLQVSAQSRPVTTASPSSLRIRVGVSPSPD